ncbi:MAG: hypothetical protein KGI56_10170, partial [Acidobacteriota bacterium]|nr:hypothetical protein [Acidobacteriota bacterium]
MRIHVDKIASVTRNLRLGRTLTLSPEILLEEGSVLACRVRGEKTTYNQLEDPHGRMSTLHDGDILVGALGHRNALQGYEGVLPASLKAGDTVNLLNMGGVIGTCLSHNPDVGKPFELEVLGQVLVFPEFQSRSGQPAHIRMGALKGTSLSPHCPVVYVAGTCMNAGKTAAACVIVRALTRGGLRVGACKLTGVSLMRDVLAMKDHGATVGLDFTDAGLPSTGPGSALPAARSILQALGAHGVDIVVAETGDGILGEYGVQEILADDELMASSAAFVLCANDPVGVVGGLEHLKGDYGIKVDLVAGPATDNGVGVRFVESLGTAAANARRDPAALGATILALVR